MLVEVTLHRHQKLIPVLLNNESNKLLSRKTKSGKHKFQKVVKRTCVTKRFACITKNGFRALARDALGLSKKSFTSAKVAWRKPGPPYSGGICG